tara:strand:+ start:58 stop:603 length:546 start_codon:yes stop_codon:yes gene_type:complete
MEIKCAICDGKTDNIKYCDSCVSSNSKAKEEEKEKLMLANVDLQIKSPMTQYHKKRSDKDALKVTKFFDKKVFKEFYSIPIIFILFWMFLTSLTVIENDVFEFLKYNSTSQTFISLFTILFMLIYSIGYTIFFVLPSLIILYFFTYPYRKNKTKRNLLFNRSALIIAAFVLYHFIKGLLLD